MDNSNYPPTTWEADPAAPWNQDEGAEDERDGYRPPEPDWWELGEPDPAEPERGHEPPELSDVEKLAVAQAFYSAVGGLVSTKGGTLRSAVNERFEELYGQTGAKSFDVRLLGEKVGTYSLTVSKPKPSTCEVGLAVDDMGELIGWADAHDMIEVRVDMEAVADWFRETGQLPPGCRAEQTVTPADPGGKVTRSTLKVDGEAVIAALGRRLEGAAVALLEGE